MNLEMYRGLVYVYDSPGEEDQAFAKRIWRQVSSSASYHSGHKRWRIPLSHGAVRELKAMGASNMLNQRRRTPVTRGLLMRVAEIYAERFSQPDARVAATFEILTLTAWAPDESQPKPLRPGSAQTRLADALGVSERKVRE